MTFSQLLSQKITEKNSCLLLGLDPNPEKFPKGIEKTAKGAEKFLKSIIDATEPYICGVKPQSAYFEAFGAEGFAVLQRILAYCHAKNLVIIMDSKRGDIGSTAKAYASAYFDATAPFPSHACTINPLMGEDTVAPFLEYAPEKAIFALLHTSNPSASDLITWNDVSVRISELLDVWAITNICPHTGYSSVAGVVGATLPPKLLQFYRSELPKTWFLCPGVGAQGGKLEDVLNIRDKNGLGVLIPVSRAVLYASAEENYAQQSAKVMKTLWESQKQTNL